MKKWQRGIALTAAVVMLFGITSCGTKKIDKTGAMKVSVLHMEGGGTPYNPDWQMLKYVKEKQNVDLELIVVPGSDYSQKRTVVLASDDIPDIIVNTWPSELGSYASSGILLPVSKYLDKLPDLKKFIKDNELDPTIKNISEPDGEFYLLPDLRKTLGGTQCFAVREDIFNELGIALPTTYQELSDALAKVKKAKPNTLGTGELYKGKEILAFMAESWNTNGGFSLPFGYSYDFTTQKWYFAPTSEQYKDLLTFLNKMYKDGALDAEAFTQDQNTYTQKLVNGQYAAFPSSGPSDAKSKQATILKADPVKNANVKVTALYPLAGPEKYGSLRKCKPSSRNQGGNAMPSSVTKKPDFDRFMDFINWFYYSQENTIVAKFGWEGVTYDKVDGQMVMRPEIRTGANPTGEKQLGKDFGASLLGITSLLPDNLPEELKGFAQDQQQFEFSEYIKANNMVTEDDPIVKFTVEQNEEVRMLVAGLTDYYETMFMKFIYGQANIETDWDNFVKQCNEKGATKLMEIVDTAWNTNK